MAHSLLQNRTGLVVQGDLTRADGHAERKAALDMGSIALAPDRRGG